jgi:hypothetical protein
MKKHLCEVQEADGGLLLRLPGKISWKFIATNMKGSIIFFHEE